MLNFLVYLINALITGISLLVLVSVILSWVVPPFHPVREFVDRLVEPLLAPIRRMMPSSGMGLDFSPMILMIGVQFLGQILINILRAMF